MAIFLSSREGHPSRDVPRRPAGPPPLLLRLAAVLVVPLVLSVLYSTGLKALDNYRFNLQADALRQEVRDLRAENIRLQEAINQARTDAAIEKVAREHLGLVKPGDHAVTLITPAGGPPSADTPAPPAPPPPPPVEQWWSHFFGPRRAP